MLCNLQSYGGSYTFNETVISKGIMEYYVT